MKAPALATAGVAFRLAPASSGRILTEEEHREACAAWWAAHADLLRRLLAAQPVAGYTCHSMHLNMLARAEDMTRYFRQEADLPPKHLQVDQEEIEEILSDFGPEGCRFGQHRDHPHIYGWFPIVPATPLTRASGRDIAARMELLRRIEALAHQQAELPSPVDGTPALPVSETPSIDTPEQKLTRLKRKLVPLAAVYYDTPPTQLPQEVVDILVAIADTAGGDMKQAISAWREACDAVGEDDKYDP
jgi:hypothetical protein